MSKQGLSFIHPSIVSHVVLGDGSFGTSNNDVVATTTCVLRHGSSSIHTFKAKAMQREEGERRFPPQHQDGQPGKEYLMDPLPVFSDPNYKPTNKLQGKVALVIGGDSGIGRAVCYSFAKEGATIAFTYVKGDPIAIPTDVRYEKNCKDVVDKVVATYGRIDVLVNNAAVQYETYTLDDITEERLERIFRTNIFSHFFMTRHAVKHMKPGSSIINTTSALGFSGSPKLIDYASTKGAIVNFTKSLAIFLIDKGIRVNEVPMNRAAQPVEIAPSYVFLASKDSSYYTGTFLHPDGGELDNAIPSVNNNNTVNP
ncbi:unnamed protein product [Lactuca saligna]|uniref:3-oxoacyl-[acyl-carrier-protein] reductase n=1 Tax=Lactuca saligna TaxID=75948 RepID=A0AA35VGH0_LACSI|nr:unnamed protein product [Lactuca saligna]